MLPSQALLFVVLHWLHPVTCLAKDGCNGVCLIIPTTSLQRSRGKSSRLHSPSLSLVRDESWATVVSSLALNSATGTSVFEVTANETHFVIKDINV